MKLKASVRFLKREAPKEYEALKEAIQSDYSAKQIELSIKESVRAAGGIPTFQERVVRHLVAAIRSGEGSIEHYIS